MIMKDAPEGADVFDIDAARAARREARAGKPNPVVKLAAGYVELKPEIDILAADEFANGRVKAGILRMLADPADFDALSAGGITSEDIEALTGFVTGKTLGE